MCLATPMKIEHINGQMAGCLRFRPNHVVAKVFRVTQHELRREHTFRGHDNCRIFFCYAVNLMPKRHERDYGIPCIPRHSIW